MGLFKNQHPTAGGPDPFLSPQSSMRQGWHGPHVDEEGREYFANSELGVSSWTDPRQETQCPGWFFLCFFLMFFVMLDGCVSKLVSPDNSPVDLLYRNHECLRQLAEGTEKHQPECPQAQQTLIECEQQKREDAKKLSKHGWFLDQD